MLAIGLAFKAGARAELASLALAPLGLAASFLGDGQQGVHRWIDLGPLHLNVAQLLLPPAIVALADRRRVSDWFLAAVMGVLLILQPDASQAAAFGGALVLVLMRKRRAAGGTRAVGLLIIAAAIGSAWERPDPLAPVPEVEQIMQLAWTVSPLAAIGASIALAGACLALGSTRTAAAWALMTYAGLAALMPLVGWFPVPLVGMAMSPIIGLWLGAGLLTAQVRRASTSTPAASGA